MGRPKAEGGEKRQNVSLLRLRQMLPETHKSLYNKVQKAQEKYRAMPVADMVKARGEKVLIINPGSQFLRIGVASEPEYIEVQHCAAYRKTKKSAKKKDPFKSKNQAIFDDEMRDKGCLEIESILGLAKNSQKGGRASTSELKIVEEYADSNKRLKLSDDDGSRIFGEEALKCIDDENYDVVFAMKNAHLHDGVTAIAILKQRLFDIWSWAIHTKLSLPKDAIKEYSAVLLIPDVLNKKEIRDMIDVVLTSLCIKEVVVHNESVAASFTHACPVTCVVNIGPQCTVAVCVEDGNVIPSSKVVLPYGRYDVFDVLKYLFERTKNWPYSKDGRLNLEEFNALEDIYFKCCRYDVDSETGTGKKQAESNMVTLRLRKSDGHCVKYELKVGREVLTAPMAFYHPSAFGVRDEEIERRNAQHLINEYEDAVDEYLFAEADFSLKKKEADNQESDPVDAGEGINDGRKYSTQCYVDGHMGLDHAVVKSILNCGKPELKDKLFQNIILVGDATEIAGSVDMLETRVLHAIPQNETFDTVNVVQSKVLKRDSIYRGGALLAVFDFIQENWIERKEWTTGGIHTEAPKKLSKMNKLTIQMLWNGTY